MIEIITLIVETGILVLLAIEVCMDYWQIRALKRMEARTIGEVSTIMATNPIEIASKLEVKKTS